jgi:hypothetical protein
MAPVLLAWVVGLILPVMSAPRASAQDAVLNREVADIEVQLRLHDIQITEMKSQVAVLQQQNQSLTAELIQITELKSQVAVLQQQNQSLTAELANIRAGKAGSSVKAPFEVVGSSGQALFRVVERGGGEVLILRQGTPMIELGLGSKGHPGLRIAGSAGVESNLAFVGAVGNAGIVNVHSDSGGAFAFIDAGDGPVPQLAVGSGESVAASLRLVDRKRGALVIFDPAGNPAVSATTNSAGLGEVDVQAGPDAVAWMRVAEDLTGGYNCAVRKGRQWCVGVNLPLTLGGK